MVGPDLQELVAPSALTSHSAKRAWCCARASFARPAYATSRIRKCLKRYAARPEIDERGSRRRSSRSEEVLQQRVDVVEVRREMVERAALEDPADDRGPLEQRLRGRRQVVDARRDERLQRVRDPIRVRRCPCRPRRACGSSPRRTAGSPRSARGPPSGGGRRLARAPATWPSSFSTSVSLSSSDSGSSSIAVDRTRPPPQPGLVSRSSGGRGRG